MSDADDKFLDDLSKMWEQTRETIESFGNKYLSAVAEEEKISGPEWVATNVELAGRMWLLGIQSMALVVQRTLDVAKDLGPRTDG
jgi:hypothetical protein